MEIWKTISEYPNYEVSSEGRVRNIKTGRVLRPCNTGIGYLKVGLSRGKKQSKKQITIHRLVANAFIPNPDSQPCVNHINGIKTDNRVENLEWVSYSENTLHAYKKGLLKPNTIGFKIGWDIIEQKKRPVRCIETGLIYPCCTDVEKIFRPSNWKQTRNIRRCCLGTQRSAYGYHWEFAD